MPIIPVALILSKAPILEDSVSIGDKESVQRLFKERKTVTQCHPQGAEYCSVYLQVVLKSYAFDLETRQRFFESTNHRIHKDGDVKHYIADTNLIQNH
ncbi:hypothetical protein Tco_1173786 [Tanacetum coccineum]